MDLGGASPALDIIRTRTLNTCWPAIPDNCKPVIASKNIGVLKLPGSFCSGGIPLD